MRRKSARLLLAVIICSALAGISFAGCGGGGTAKLESPLEFFNQARENMQNASSFRMDGIMLMEFREVPGMASMAIDYDMVCELKEDGELLARVDMSVADPYAMDMEMYILEGKMYMEMPGGIWVYEEMDLGSDLIDMSQGMGPQYMMDILDLAETAEVVDEDGESITYSLVLDYQKIMAEVDVEMMRERFLEQGMPEDYLSATMQMMEDMVAAMDVEVTADKESGMVTRFGMYVEMDLEAMAPFFEGGQLPPGAKIAMDADFAVGDYGETFDIRLPEAARDAVPLEELEGQV